MAETPTSAKQLRAMLRAQDYERALPVLDELIRKNPNDAPAHWHRASCLEAFGRIAEALGAVKHVLRITPNYAPAWIKQAELAVRLDPYYPDYAADLRRAIEIDSDIAASRSALAHSPQNEPSTAPPRIKTLDDVLAQFASDDPSDRAATKIAFKIFSLGNLAPPLFVPKRIEDYPNFQRTFARQALQKMAALGFEHLGDFEPMHLQEMLEKPTLVRIYSGDQGSIFGASYRIAPKWPGLLEFVLRWYSGTWKTLAAIDLQSAFDNGKFLVTNNTSDVNPFADGGNILSEKLDPSTRIEDVVKRHRARVAEYLDIHHKVQTLCAPTMELIMPLLAKISASKNRYRQSIGYVTEAELRQMLGSHYDKLAHRVRTRLNALANTA